MREQLQQYVKLLFAGAENCEDIQQEILQNTLDRYDDLIAEGKVPEAAYRLAITGIGDISEILGITPKPVSPAPVMEQTATPDTPANKRMRAIGVGLYILSAIPLFLFSEFGMSTLGLCGTLCIVAVATVMVLLGKNDSPKEEEQAVPLSPDAKLRSSIGRIIWCAGLICYFVVCVITGAWGITWLIFPICAVANKLMGAILDYKEASEHET